jgi:hypothetical protein
MEIIDAQVHQPLPLTPWGDDLAKEAQLLVGVELLIAAMEAVGVGAGVNYSSAEFCATAHDRYPTKFVGVLSLGQPKDIPDPDSFFGGLRARGIVAVRILPGMPYTGERLALLTEGHWDPALTSAAKHDIPVVLFIPQHLRLVRDVVRKHPDLTVIIDHFGMVAPPTYPLSDNLLDSVPELVELGQFPNIAVKFTGVPALSVKDYPFSDLWPQVHRVIDAFKPERLMWGSDYTRVMGRHVHPPMKGGRLNYAELLDFLKYTSEVSDSDKEWMFSGATRRWLRWPNATAASAGGFAAP